MDKKDVNVERIADQIIDQEFKKKEALSILLDQYLSKGDKLFVEKTEMGGTEAYVGSVTLHWLSERVKFAMNLPLFENHLVVDKDKGTKKIEISKESLQKISILLFVNILTNNIHFLYKHL